MRTSPDAHSLLAIALETYRAEILPAVPPEKRYTALMVANALAIAERELAGRDAVGHAMLKAMAPIYGEDAEDTLSGAALEERVDALQRRLCADIAAGDFDAPGEDHAALMECLDTTVRVRLAIDNPKALKTAG